MAISQQLLIITVVCGLLLALLLTVALSVYFCCCRKRAATRKRTHRDHTSAHVDDIQENGGKMRLDKLPSAAQTKRMEEGQQFVSGDGPENGKANGVVASSADTTNYIMGPSADIAERGADNAGFSKDNQMESSAYLRGGIDPADVAEVFMNDEYLKQASRSRRQRQVEVRREISRKKSQVASKKRRSQKNSAKKQASSEKQKENSSKKSSKKSTKT